MNDLQRAVLLRAALKIIGDLRSTNSAKVLPLFEPGDRKTVRLGGVRLGTVQLTDPKGTWQVISGREHIFREWVKENHPHAIVETVDPQWQKAFLGGDPTAGTGEIPPGIDFIMSTPAYRVEPSPEALSMITTTPVLRELTAGD